MAALKKQQKQQVLVINEKIELVLGMTREEDLVQTLKTLTENKLKDSIEQFQSETGYKLLFQTTPIYQSAVDSDVYFKLFDKSKDFVKVRPSGAGVKGLRGRVNGLVVDIKISKENEYSFSNEEIGAALIELAHEVLSYSTQLVTLEECDVREALLGVVSEIAEEEELTVEEELVDPVAEDTDVLEEEPDHEEYPS